MISEDQIFQSFPKEAVFKWHDEIQIVEGFARACLYDLNRSTFSFAPKEIVNIVPFIEGKSFDEIHLLFPNFSEWQIEFANLEYFTWVSKQLFTLFRKIEVKWQASSSLLYVVLIDIFTISNALLQHLEWCGVRHIHCVTNANLSETEICQLIEQYLSIDGVQSLTISLPNSILTKRFVKAIKKKYPIILNITNTQFVKSYDSEELFVPEFVVAIKPYMQAKLHNLYHSKKAFVHSDEMVSLDFENKFKIFRIDSSSSKQEFKQVLLSETVDALWNLKKDDIDVCKDCELRYMCVDKRIPSKRKNNSLYYESQCAYNPYIALWNDDPRYKSLIDSGVICSEHEFSINKKTLLEVYTSIWGSESISYELE